MQNIDDVTEIVKMLCAHGYEVHIKTVKGINKTLECIDATKYIYDNDTDGKTNN